MHYDCLVIGLGGMGSSALYHLAKRGHHVCGLEQFTPVHDRGSSHGQFRVFRKAYFEHPDYVPLLQTAEQLWRELESESGVTLYDRIGVVLSGPEDGEAVAGTLTAANLHRLPVEQLSPQEARQRWPLLQFPDEDSVVLDADAGILAVEECVAQQLNRARDLGAETCFGETVKSWNATSDSVTVTTDRAVHTAQSVVFAGGAWSQSLLSPHLPPLRVLHKLQLWYSVNGQSLANMAGHPAFLFETPGGAFYGMPSGPTEMKLARHTGGPLVPDPSAPGERAWDEELEPCVQFAADYLRGISREPVRTSPCLYTVSSDGHFVVDRHPEFERVVCAAGFSGHGFKFASVMGAVLADLATLGRTEFPVDFLGLSRFH